MFLSDNLIGFIAPFDCLVCSQEGSLLCPECAATVRHPKRSTCFLCNQLTEDFKTCRTCRGKTALRSVWVSGRYEAHIKELIRLFKYERAQAAAKPLARILGDSLPLRSYGLVSCVPSATSRYRLRGYNPAGLIAHEYARTNGLAFQDTLGRLGQARQVGSSRKQRLSQLEAAFYCLRARPVKDKTILLIDDVVTTGATLRAAAKVLKAAGAKHIDAAVIAKH